MLLSGSGCETFMIEAHGRERKTSSPLYEEKKSFVTEAKDSVTPLKKHVNICRAVLRQWKRGHTAVRALGLAAEDDAGARATKTLVGRCGHNVGVHERVVLLPCGDQPADVRDVRHQEGAAGVRNLDSSREKWGEKHANETEGTKWLKITLNVPKFLGIFPGEFIKKIKKRPY